jgi:hypothetical protein
MLIHHAPLGVVLRKDLFHRQSFCEEKPHFRPPIFVSTIGAELADERFEKDTLECLPDRVLGFSGRQCSAA